MRLQAIPKLLLPDLITGHDDHRAKATLLCLCSQCPHHVICLYTRHSQHRDAQSIYQGQHLANCFSQCWWVLAALSFVLWVQPIPAGQK